MNIRGTSRPQATSKTELSGTSVSDSKMLTVITKSSISDAEGTVDAHPATCTHLNTRLCMYTHICTHTCSNNLKNTKSCKETKNKIIRTANNLCILYLISQISSTLTSI